MKKKTLCLALLLVMTLLCGCNAMSAAEAAIADIGTVTLDSGEKIADAEALVAMLNDAQKENIPNLTELEEAKERLAELESMVEDTQTAIGQIGDVTPDSGSAISKARACYDALKAEGLENAVKDSYSILTDAESTLANQMELLDTFQSRVDAIGEVTLESKDAIDDARYVWRTIQRKGLEAYVADKAEEFCELEAEYGLLHAENLFGQALEAAEEGFVSCALDYFDELCDTYPDAAQIARESELVEILVAYAQAAFDQGLYEETEVTISSLRSNFPDSNALYSALDEELAAVLEAIRPANGELLFNNIGSSYCKFQVSADSKQDSLVKLESADNDSLYMLLYVRAGETASVSVGTGNYIVKYTTGENWYGEDAMFGTNASFSKADDVFEFEISYSGNYVYYSEISITLYTVIGGNMSTVPINEDDF